MICRQWTLVKHSLTYKQVQPLICKCWHCEYCNPIRQRQLAKLARDGQPTTFITLTVNPAVGADPADRARQLAHAWLLVRRAMKRRWKLTKIPFLAIFESTQKGEPHLHILARLPYMAHAWLSAQMDRLIGAPVVDIRRVRSQKGVASYVAKYTSKEPVMWPGTKRYWRSLDWIVVKKSNDKNAYSAVETWARLSCHPLTYIATLLDWGWSCTLDRDRWTCLPKKGLQPP